MVRPAPGIIDEQLVARPVGLAQDGILPSEPAPILLAELAVLPAVRLRALVLLPQQHARDARPPELRVQLGEVRRRRESDFQQLDTAVRDRLLYGGSVERTNARSCRRFLTPEDNQSN